MEQKRQYQSPFGMVVSLGCGGRERDKMRRKTRSRRGLPCSSRCVFPCHSRRIATGGSHYPHCDTPDSTADAFSSGGKQESINKSLLVSLLHHTTVTSDQETPLNQCPQGYGVLSHHFTRTLLPRHAAVQLPSQHRQLGGRCYHGDGSLPVDEVIGRLFLGLGGRGLGLLEWSTTPTRSREWWWRF